MNIFNRLGVILIAVLLLGCEAKPIKLSSSEIYRMNSLQKEVNAKRKLYDMYKAEKERVAALEDSYLDKYVSIKNLKVKKSSNFKDGLTRACLTGTLKNNGSELVDEIDYEFELYSKSGGLVYTWDKSLYDSNDILMNNKSASNAQTILLLKSLGTETIYPLKPKEVVNLSKGRSCMSDSIADWDESSVNAKLKKLKLRPKMNFDQTEFWQLTSELLELKDRAKKNGQIAKQEPH